jgi:vacuolar-type H+-ATPase subunit E/Vma4
MALAELISRLEQEAQLRIEALQRDGEEQVRAIKAATGLAASTLTTTYLEQQRTEREAAHARVLAAARARARAREIEATHAQVARILDRARDLIEDIAASPTYAAVLPLHVDEALSFLEGLQPRVRCRCRFATLVGPAVARHTGASLVVDESVGVGIVAESHDGAVVVDNTLSARLALRHRDLMPALARRLSDGSR